jgi:hypothetical protein
MIYNVPILFIIFNRPEVAKKSFDSIKKRKPKKLYIACDGARPNKEGEKEKVEATRSAILDSIDWDCEIKTLFQSENLGCGQGVFTAISWFFNNESQGIILEDDCVANESFFIFMEEMLERFKNDLRIGMIAGTNPIKVVSEFSYVFSKYKSCWGWATWARSWKQMDYNMSWRKHDEKSVINNCGFNGLDYKVWHKKMINAELNKHNIWDHQWYYSLSMQNQLCVYPKTNLVSNIGFGKDATNTWFTETYIESEELTFPLIHNPIFAPDYNHDRLFFMKDNNLKTRFVRQIKSIIPSTIKDRIRLMLSK